MCFVAKHTKQQKDTKYLPTTLDLRKLAKRQNGKAKTRQRASRESNIEETDDPTRAGKAKSQGDKAGGEGRGERRRGGEQESGRGAPREETEGKQVLLERKAGSEVTSDRRFRLQAQRTNVLAFMM